MATVSVVRVSSATNAQECVTQGAVSKASGKDVTKFSAQHSFRGLQQPTNNPEKRAKDTNIFYKDAGNIWFVQKKMHVSSGRRSYIMPLSLAKMKFDERQKRYRKTGVSGGITDVISLESNLMIYCNLKYKYSLTVISTSWNLSHMCSHKCRETNTVVLWQEQKIGHLCCF